MQLLDLIADATGVTAADKDAAARLLVTGLTSDSREVRAGYLFAAFPGLKQDGRQFVNDAIAKGAAAVLVPEGTVVDTPGSAIVIADKNPRQRFARMAAAFYGKQMDVVVAVTGTNGKSSTVNFCRQIWQSMEHAAASLGTIGIIAPGINRAGSLTTPDPVTLHSEIAELEASGVTHLALEASSQGMDQYRLDGLQLTAAGFTNLTRDHLDYHGTMDSYFAAKARLFTEMLPPTGIAVINADSWESTKIRELCAARGTRVIDYGMNAADIKLVQRKPLPDGQFIELKLFGERYELELPLVGDFQAANALCALGLVLAEDPDNRLLHMQGVYALERLQSVRGRLEFAAKHPNGAAIYVDYAHTPGRLHVVFGCGGDRDKGKRPMMGEIAARVADKIYVTDDNPRTEDASMVRADIMKGVAGSSKVKEIAGRRDAIRDAIRQLGPDDVLVIAGKGHEQGQIVGKEILPFDDVTEAKTAVLEVTK